jgi:CheY-like chemotaxis protein
MRQKGVLILEDTALLLVQLKELCEDAKYKVFDCYTIYEAMEAWNNHHDEIDIIVTDINMDSNGLTDDEARSTKDGKFSGWLWVHNHVILADTFPVENVIILSEYNKDLSGYTKDSGVPKQNENYKIIHDNNHLIDKVDPSGATQKLMNALRRL